MSTPPFWNQHWFRYYLPALLQGLVIFFLSSRPGSDFPSVPIAHFDKFVHFCLFFAFSFLLLRAFCQGNPTGRLRFWMLTALLISCAYGYIDEFVHQALRPSRSVEWGDFVANCVGAVSGVFFIFLYFKIKESVGVLKVWDASKRSNKPSSLKTGA